MNLKIFLFRFGSLALLTLAGGILFVPTIHLLIMTGTMPSTEGFGKILTQQTAFVYMGSILAGLAGIFIRDNWRWVLYLCPLYAPALFAVIYTLIHR